MRKKRSNEIERRVGVGSIDGAKLNMEGKMEGNQREPMETRGELMEGKVTQSYGGIQKRRGEEMIRCALVELKGN